MGFGREELGDNGGGNCEERPGILGERGRFPGYMLEGQIGSGSCKLWGKNIAGDREFLRGMEGVGVIWREGLPASGREGERREMSNGVGRRLELFRWGREDLPK